MEQENRYDASIHLSYNDLAVDDPANPSVISMLIKKSKTDQGRRGAKIYLGKTASYRGIFTSKGIHFRFTLPMGATHPLIKVKLCKTCKSSSGGSWSPSQRLCWSQLQDWCHHCSCSWLRRFSHSDPRSVGESAFKRYIRLDSKYVALTSSTLAQCQI